jgi:hypothetical protein
MIRFKEFTWQRSREAVSRLRHATDYCELGGLFFPFSPRISSSTSYLFLALLDKLIIRRDLNSCFLDICGHDLKSLDIANLCLLTSYGLEALDKSSIPRSVTDLRCQFLDLE